MSSFQHILQKVLWFFVYPKQIQSLMLDGCWWTADWRRSWQMNRYYLYRSSWSLLFFKPLPSRFRINHHICIKPFEAPQRSVKMEVWVNFYFNVTSWIVGTRRGKKWSSENMADLKEDLSEEILFYYEKELYRECFKSCSLEKKSYSF